MLLPHHGFTVLLTENSKVLIEIAVSTLVFTISVPLKSGQININQTIPEKGKN